MGRRRARSPCVVRLPPYSPPRTAIAEATDPAPGTHHPCAGWPPSSPTAPCRRGSASRVRQTRRRTMRYPRRTTPSTFARPMRSWRGSRLRSAPSGSATASMRPVASSTEVSTLDRQPCYTARLERSLQSPLPLKRSNAQIQTKNQPRLPRAVICVSPDMSLRFGKSSTSLLGTQRQSAGGHHHNVRSPPGKFQEVGPFCEDDGGSRVARP
eukprot:3159320-Prymnesium_polylepis.2